MIPLPTFFTFAREFDDPIIVQRKLSNPGVGATNAIQG